MDEAAIKNDTAAASWAKLGNAISNYFTGGKGAAASKFVAEFFGAWFHSADEYRKEIIDPLDQMAEKVNKLGAAATATAAEAKSVQELATRYKELAAIGGALEVFSPEQRAEFDAVTLSLREALGAGVVGLNKETGALEVNADALERATSAKVAAADTDAAVLVKRLEALDQERFRLEALAKAEGEAANATRQRLLAAGVPRRNFDPETVRDIKGAVKTYKTDPGATSVPKDQFFQSNYSLDPSQLQGVLNYNQAATNAVKATREVDAKAAETEVVLANLARLGYGEAADRAALLARVNGRVVEGNDDLVKSEKELAKEQAKAAKAARELADARNRAAEAAYELKKSRLERAAGAADRTAEAPETDQPGRAAAVDQATDKRKELAALEQAEALRRLKFQASRELTTAEEIATRKLLISEQYRAKIEEIDREQNETLKALQNEFLEALAAGDAARIEGEQNALQAVVNNEAGTYAGRMAAARQFWANEKALAELTYQGQVRAANGNAEAIAVAAQNLKNTLAKIRAEEKFFDADKANQEAEGAFKRLSVGLEQLRNRRRKPAARSLDPEAAARADDGAPVPDQVQEAYGGVNLNNARNYHQALFEIENQYRKKRLENLAADATKTNEYTDEKLQYEQWYREQQNQLAEQEMARTQERIQQVGELIQTGVQVYTQSLDNQLAALEKQKNNELKVAGNNEKAKSKIEARYEAEAAKIRRKKAIAERGLALAQIAFNTATAISKAVAESPLTFGLPWSAVALALGVAQAAVVLTQPLPAYAKGTKSAPHTGPALVGEAGPELVQEPGGRAYLVDRPAIVRLVKGTRVYTNAETRRAKEAGGALQAAYERAGVVQEGPAVRAGYDAARARLTVLTTGGLNPAHVAQAVARELAPAVAAMEAVAHRPAPSVNVALTDQGVEVWIKNAGHRERVLDNRYKRTR